MDSQCLSIREDVSKGVHLEGAIEKQITDYE